MTPMLATAARENADVAVKTVGATWVASVIAVVFRSGKRRGWSDGVYKCGVATSEGETRLGPSRLGRSDTASLVSVGKLSYVNVTIPDSHVTSMSRDALAANPAISKRCIDHHPSLSSASIGGCCPLLSAVSLFLSTVCQDHSNSLHASSLSFSSPCAQSPNHIISSEVFGNKTSNMSLRDGKQRHSSR